jgi:hypothetical protein
MENKKNKKISIMLTILAIISFLLPLLFIKVNIINFNVAMLITDILAVIFLVIALYIRK